jgi:hypothetical protein
MSLNLDKFSQYVVAGEKIDYIAIRLGEAYVIPFEIKDNLDQPVDLTGWNFAVTSTLYTATFTYNGDTLSSVTNIVAQNSDQHSNTGEARTVAGLEVVNISAAAGTGSLKVPASVTPSPQELVTPTGTNTILNLLTITATYPSSVAGFNNIRKLLIGLVIGFGG